MQRLIRIGLSMCERYRLTIIIRHTNKTLNKTISVTFVKLELNGNTIIQKKLI